MGMSFSRAVSRYTVWSASCDRRLYRSCLSLVRKRRLDPAQVQELTALHALLRRLGLVQRAAANVTNIQGYNTLDALRRLQDEDIVRLARTMRKPGGAPNAGGNGISVPPRHRNEPQAVVLLPTTHEANQQNRPGSGHHRGSNPRLGVTQIMGGQVRESPRTNLPVHQGLDENNRSPRGVLSIVLRYDLEDTTSVRGAGGPRNPRW